MKVLVNSIMTRGLDMKKIIEEVTELDVEYCLIGNTLYINSTEILKSTFESAQNILRFDTEQENNGLGWYHVFGAKDFKEIVEKTAESKGLEYEYFNPEVLCIEYITNAHFNSGKMDQPDKYFCSRNEDLEELAEQLNWIKYRKEGMKVWFDEILLLVEVATMPSSEPIFVKDDFYTVEQWQELQVRNDMYAEEGGTPDLYKVVGWVETQQEAIEWMNS